MITQEFVGEHLLFPLFRCIGSAYKERYKRTIWEQFENNIRSAAYTGRITQFYENICNTMPIEVEAQYLSGIAQVLQSGMDKEILDWLRSETAYLVLVARMKNEERKAEYQERQDENARLDAELEEHVKEIRKPKKQPQQQEVESENLFV